MLSYCYHQVHFYKTQWFVFLPAVSDVWTYWIWTPSMSVFLSCQLGMLSVSGPLALLLCFCSLAHWPRLRYIRSSSFGTHAFSERLLFLQQWKKPGRSWQWNDGHGFRTRKNMGNKKTKQKSQEFEVTLKICFKTIQNAQRLSHQHTTPMPYKYVWTYRPDTTVNVLFWLSWNRKKEGRNYPIKTRVI